MSGNRIFAAWIFTSSKHQSDANGVAFGCSLLVLCIIRNGTGQRSTNPS
jgi:hypothetical protein